METIEGEKENIVGKYLAWAEDSHSNDCKGCKITGNWVLPATLSMQQLALYLLIYIPLVLGSALCTLFITNIMF